MYGVVQNWNPFVTKYVIEPQRNLTIGVLGLDPQCTNANFLILLFALEL